MSMAGSGLPNTAQHRNSRVPQDVLDKLAELGMVHLEVDSAPSLTEHGERTYIAMEAGDDIPEFDYEAE